MFTGASILAALSKLLAPIAESFFSAFGEAVNDWLRDRRAAQAQHDIGRLEAQAEQSADVIASTRAQLDAAIAAPKSIDDAIARLEDGTA